MDPIAQILAQQSSGSAEGQGFGNFYVQGRQLNLSQQHLDLAKKAEARAQAEQDALLPVQKQLLENQAILQGANLGTIETASNVKAEMAMAGPLINDLQFKITKDPNGYASNDNYNEWLKLLSKYPWAGHTQNGSEIDLGFKAVHMRSLQALELKKADLAGARGFNYATPEGKAAYNKQAAFDEVQRLAASPEYQRSFDASKMVQGWYDPDTGHYDPEKVAVSLQQMPRSEALQVKTNIASQHEALLNQRDAINNAFAQGRINNETYRLQLEANGLALRGISQDIQAGQLGVTIAGRPSIPTPPTSPIVQQPQAQQPPDDVMGPFPSAVPSNPQVDALQPSTVSPPTLIQGARPLTPAGTTKFQEKSAQLDNAIRSLDETISNIDQNPDAFGIVGSGKSLLETGSGLIDPLADQRVNNLRNQADIAFTQVAPGLRVDSGNMSRYELNQLENAAKITKATVSPIMARNKAINIRNAAIGQKLRIDKSLYISPKPSLLAKIPVTELKDMAESGLLDDDAILTLGRMGKISFDDMNTLKKLRPPEPKK